MVAIAVEMEKHAQTAGDTPIHHCHAPLDLCMKEDTTCE